MTDQTDDTGTTRELERETAIEEADHVEECPVCETEFVGVTPDEYREEHRGECNPLVGLLCFPREEA